MSVLSTQSVPQILHVSITNVAIHALVCVGRMPHVLSTITTQYVRVIQDTLEIHSRHVILNLNPHDKQKQLTHVIPHLVDQMLYVTEEAMLRHVNVSQIILVILMLPVDRSV